MAKIENFDKIDVLYNELLSISIYRGVLQQPVTASVVNLLRAVCHKDVEATCKVWGKLCNTLSQKRNLDSLPSAIAKEVLLDENVFVLELAKKNVENDLSQLSNTLVSFAKRDLQILYRAANINPETLLMRVDLKLNSFLPKWGNEPAKAPLDYPWENCLNALKNFHKKNGCGNFAFYTAYLWRDGNMHPARHPDPIRISDLKDYEYQRRIAIGNTRAFLDGLEANNMLLYGDRGTGKSSTVKALLNEYASEGLRMIEMPKEYLRQLPDLTEQLSILPLKFIIFIDDLSFSSGDDNFAALKAVLEGGLASRPNNVLIYATSNRRHLLRETFSDRNGDEVHSADTMQEAVSLSDRFGIFLTFLMPDKQHFLNIVEQMAKDYGIKVERQKLLEAAEQWALERGARSPRYARQFITDVQARLSRGKQI